MGRAYIEGIRWLTVATSPHKYVALFRPNMLEDHQRHGTLKGACLVYSMWSGYLAQGQYNPLRTFLDEEDIAVVSHHVSGHAAREDLARGGRA